MVKLVLEGSWQWLNITKNNQKYILYFLMSVLILWKYNRLGHWLALSSVIDEGLHFRKYILYVFRV